MKIIIEGDLEDVDKIHDYGHGDLPVLYIGRRDYYVARDEDHAGEAAAKRWQEMAEGDPKEFIALIGEERLVGWALGHSDSFGIFDLEDFLEKVANHPEEEFASYDGRSLECTTDPNDFQPLLDQINAWEELTQIEFLWPEDRGDKDLKTENEEANDQLDEIDAIIAELAETAAELGFDPTVAYRHN